MVKADFELVLIVIKKIKWEAVTKISHTHDNDDNGYGVTFAEKICRKADKKSINYVHEVGA